MLTINSLAIDSTAGLAAAKPFAGRDETGEGDRVMTFPCWFVAAELLECDIQMNEGPNECEYTELNNCRN